MATTENKSPLVDYTYYINTYHGNKISDDAFEHAELEAEAYVDSITFGRICKLTEIPNYVRNAICSAAETIQEYIDSRANTIKSESNDGWSASYSDVVAETELEKGIRNKVRRHLSNSGLLYKGWSIKYDSE